MIIPPIVEDYLRLVKKGDRIKANLTLSCMTAKASQLAIALEFEWKENQSILEQAAKDHKVLTTQELSRITGVKRPTEGKRNGYYQRKLVLENGRIAGWKVEKM